VRPPLTTALSFIDCINRGDTEGLAALMTDHHTLTVFAESPLVGRSLPLGSFSVRSRGRRKALTPTRTTIFEARVF
jgi:hypothetical protein